MKSKNNQGKLKQKDEKDKKAKSNKKEIKQYSFKEIKESDHLPLLWEFLWELPRLYNAFRQVLFNFFAAQFKILHLTHTTELQRYQTSE